jgi:ABC-type Fe3+/spermidine/putrescine transport system ATPase subunit
MYSIHFSKLKKHFGDVLALDIDVLDIPPGQIVCFVGPSGCGKTTALRTIAGLVRHDEGDVFFGDRIVNDLAPEHRNAAMVFQNYALFPHMTVNENVAFGLTVRKKSKAEIAEKVQATLALVQLPDVGDRFPKQLSGGQQQRIAVARALATEPEILLFDEPLSNLDAKLREYMRFELRQLLEKLEVTTVYVTHDQTEAMVIGDRLIVMKDGRIIQDAPPSQVYRRPANRFVADFIGSASFIEGRVSDEAREDGLLRLDTADGLSIWGTGVEVGPGDAAVACIRPEAVQIVAGDKPAGAGNAARRLDAVVQIATDLGEVKETHLAVGDWNILARVPTSRSLSAGDRVAIEILTDHCTIVAP